MLSNSTKESEIVYFGAVPIRSQWCGNCKSKSFVIDGLFTCCGDDAPQGEITSKRRIGSNPWGRKKPKITDQNKILIQQNYSCFYCGKSLDSSVEIEWDHFVPYSFTVSNQVDNFVASCSGCNKLKGSKMFDDVEEARQYLWKKKRS